MHRGEVSSIAERAQRERRLAQLSDDNAFVDVNAVLQRGVGGAGGGVESVSGPSSSGRAGARPGEGSCATEVFLGDRTFVLRKRQRVNCSAGAEAHTAAEAANVNTSMNSVTSTSAYAGGGGGGGNGVIYSSRSGANSASSAAAALTVHLTASVADQHKNYLSTEEDAFDEAVEQWERLVAACMETTGMEGSRPVELMSKGRASVTTERGKATAGTKRGRGGKGGRGRSNDPVEKRGETVIAESRQGMRTEGHGMGARKNSETVVLRDWIDMREDAAVLSAQAAAEWSIVQAWRRAMNMADDLPSMLCISGSPRRATESSEQEKKDDLSALVEAKKTDSCVRSNSAAHALQEQCSNNNDNVRRRGSSNDSSGSSMDATEVRRSCLCPLPEALVKFYAVCPSTQALSASYQSNRESLFDDLRLRQGCEVVGSDACTKNAKPRKSVHVPKYGYHLCSVCMLPASYRCVRCRSALFCSIECHVIHDATRCLKFTV